MTIFVGVIYAYKGLLLVSLNLNLSPVVSSQLKEMIKLMKIL